MVELFFLCCEGIRDIELSEALERLLAIFMEGLQNGTVQIDESVRRDLIDWYVSQPMFIQRLCARLKKEEPQLLLKSSVIRF
jgi:hypothetical protein